MIASLEASIVGAPSEAETSALTASAMIVPGSKAVDGRIGQGNSRGVHSAIATADSGSATKTIAGDRRHRGGERFDIADHVAGRFERLDIVQEAGRPQSFDLGLGVEQNRVETRSGALDHRLTDQRLAVRAAQHPAGQRDDRGKFKGPEDRAAIDGECQRRDGLQFANEAAELGRLDRLNRDRGGAIEAELYAAAQQGGAGARRRQRGEEGDRDAPDRAQVGGRCRRLRGAGDKQLSCAIGRPGLAGGVAIERADAGCDAGADQAAHVGVSNRADVRSQGDRSVHAREHGTRNAGERLRVTLFSARWKLGQLLAQVERQGAGPFECFPSRDTFISRLTETGTLAPDPQRLGI